MGSRVNTEIQWLLNERKPHESAKQVLGGKTLQVMAREHVDMVRKNVTIDWTLRESVQAKLRVMVRHILKKYG